MASSSGDDRPKALQLTTIIRALSGRAPAAAPLLPSPPASTAACVVGYPPVIGYPPPPPHQVQSEHYSTSHFQPTYLKCAIVMTVVVAITTFLTISIVIHILLRPKIPVIQLYDFTISNFTLTVFTLTANYEANITVENPSTSLRVDFIMGSQIFYKHTNNYLSLDGYVPKTHLGGGATTFIDLEMSNDRRLVDPDLIKEMKGELQTTKSLSFGLMVDMSCKFKHSWWWKKEVYANYLCDDLKVDFAADDPHFLFGTLSTTTSCIPFS